MDNFQNYRLKTELFFRSFQSSLEDVFHKKFTFYTIYCQLSENDDDACAFLANLQQFIKDWIIFEFAKSSWLKAIVPE